MKVRFDSERHQRIGLPEAVLCEGKDDESLGEFLNERARDGTKPLLLTRMSAAQTILIPAASQFDYDHVSRTAFLNGCLSPINGRVTVVSAGTADLAVAAEAARTLQFHGITAPLIVDVGVAGLWRLLDVLDQLAGCDVLIVVAGMDAALVSVVAGLVGTPIVGVPTSVGYGVALGGRSALDSMLASCAQGVVVTNIDNGFGAACAALRIVRRLVAQ